MNTISQPPTVTQRDCVEARTDKVENAANSFARRFLWAGFLTAVFLTPACTAHKKPSTIETALATMAKDMVIPLEAEDLKNPLPNNQQVVSEGQQIYAQACAVCHAADGRGQTPLGQGMYPPAMDLTSPHVQHWNDSEMFWIVQNGVRLTGMASWKGVISPNDTWKLVIFVHHLPEIDAAEGRKASEPQPSPKTPAQLLAYGKTLYRQEGCFTCHQLEGEGTKVGPDLTIEGTRRRSAAWLIGHFKKPAAYVPGSIMPSFTNLTDEQLSALTAFLESQKGSTK
jgi:mono/diheme cytochrome c family protein